MCLVSSDFDDINIAVSPANIIRFGIEVTLKIRVFAAPAATEIRLTRRDGPFFSTANSYLNRELGLVIMNMPNQVEYKFPADSSWNGNLSVYVSHPLRNDTAYARITVLGELCYMATLESD